MPDLKRYSTTKVTALSVGMTSGDTAVTLVDGSSYPDPAVGGNGSYTVLIGYGSDREEICTVTAKPSINVLTVTRAEDGSAATAKNVGDVVVHGVSKRDWDDMLDKGNGGTMVGNLILAGDPSSALMAATKRYVDASIPIGQISMFGSATPPTGYLLCNGQSTTGYAALAAIVGANVPDLRSRFIVGTGTGTGLSTYAQGGTGGLETVTLSAAESGVPVHTHDVPHGTDVALPIAGTGESIMITGTSGSTTSYDNTAAAASAAHQNRPPYYALAFIVKAV